MCPPDHAVVLCVDEKTQVQALDRTQPIFPLLPEYPNAGATTTSATGPSTCTPPQSGHRGDHPPAHAQHRAIEFKKFLVLIDKSCPPNWTSTS